MKKKKVNEKIYCSAAYPDIAGFYTTDMGEMYFIGDGRDVWIDSYDRAKIILWWLKEQELYVFTKEELESLLRYAFNEGDNAEPGIAGWLQRAEDIFIESLGIK